MDKQDVRRDGSGRPLFPWEADPKNYVKGKNAAPATPVQQEAAPTPEGDVPAGDAAGDATAGDADQAPTEATGDDAGRPFLKRR